MTVTVKKEVLKKFAHDLRSPLSVIRGYVEFKSQDRLDGDERAYLEALRLSTDKIEKIAAEIDASVPRDFQADMSPICIAAYGQDDSRRCVLIVDDDISLRLQWRLFFRGRNIQTIETASGEELLHRKLDYTNIRQAIVDYNFEGSSLNGFDVIEFLQQKGVEQIHLCTGQYSEEAVQNRARSLGIMSVIPKPLDHKLCENIFGT